MKTLIIVIHSDLKHSVINKRWLEELAKYPDRYVVHDLHQVYPDEKLDIINEQQLVEAYDKIVFQFPFYWFNCPPLFKKWLDEVLTHGWAYGKGSSYKLQGKKLAMGITAGIEAEDYHPAGRYKYTLEQLVAPFEITFEYVRADYRSFFAFYGAEHRAIPQRVEQSALDYLAFIDAL
ncbi:MULTISPECIES: NAD(P)H-dependent oxidoreductase [Olivibacter]|jgi:putative NADPH-quinone reductase|uniref:NAD(P)H-dependent oxidoreductase n=2 Tax=Olivibacter TaxID=376469 RepID=A0ABV6HUJ9_9SPHI|nr:MULTISPECIES: NAD(P)H-dependent oxidoreductase [unclassified Olivibacter]MCL4640396.1 NAD(P)H-dependent oxidoreductase [Olivibacter sp. UJ_SKK_5.1]MDM8176266.1 NAD(P)H-dependent oxidoreductase [Olivibacter sp. 47]MDX3915764.1 NAD(P)H-dependent oxidoreductase [Pseudosphingobacterium sp.]QEL01028.1 NAD(P)H-dependent oxidoreductase [Olivibacter sp. LS-1]